MKFDEVTFSGKLEGMNTLYVKGLTPNYIPSKYFQSRYDKGQGARTMDIIYDVLRLYKGTADNKAFVAEYNKGYIAEVQEKEQTICASLLKKKDKSWYIKGCSIDENDISSSLILDNSTKIVVMLALMPLILEDEEAKEIYDTMSDFLEWSEDDDAWLLNDHIAEFSQLLNRFSINVEMRLNDTIKVDTEKVSMLKSTDRNIDGMKVYAGSPVYFINSKSTQQTPTTKTKEKEEFAGRYAYNPDRVYSEEEKNIMAKVPEKYIMPDFVPEICELFKESSDFPAPMRVAYLLGPAGTGKTEGANAIFAGLGLPGGHYTCNPATEIFDFIGQVFPNTGCEDISWSSIREELNLPDTEDVVNDPEAAYEKIYGKKPSAYPDEGKLIVEIINRVMEHMVQKGTNGKTFTYVESGLIKAVRNGWGFEIQEIGCILRPGVAVGLNALLETGGNAFITLPTGETIKKHPDCTFVFTSNDEYEGTCNLNQSVLDRMALVYRIDNPPKEVMKTRIIARLNFPDEKILDRMIDVIYDISKASKEKAIEDGVCGYRSLENWAMSVMIMSRKNGGIITDDVVYKAGITAVLNKCSQKREYVEELMTCLTYYFAAPKLI